MQKEFFSNFTERQQEYLKKLQIFTLHDLLSYFPRAYLDLTKQSKLEECYVNDMVFLSATLVQSAELIVRGKQKFIKANFALYADGGKIKESFSCVWFNAPYVVNKLKTVGEEFLLYGRLQKNKYGNYSIINPSFESKEHNNNLKGLIPIYPLKGTVKQGNVRVLVQKALTMAKITSYIPVELQKKYKLFSLAQSYKIVHAPKNVKEKSIASERIAIEEYFILLSAFKIFKGNQENKRTLKYSCSREEVQSFIERFPFTLTKAQQQAIADIYNDLKRQRKMNKYLLDLSL